MFAAWHHFGSGLRVLNQDELSEIIQQPFSSYDSFVIPTTITTMPTTMTTVTTRTKSSSKTSASDAVKKFPCAKCPRQFLQYCSLWRHLKFECGKDPRFKCPYCEFLTKQTSRVYKHVRKLHAGYVCYCIDMRDNKEITPNKH